MLCWHSDEPKVAFHYCMNVTGGRLEWVQTNADTNSPTKYHFSFFFFIVFFHFSISNAQCWSFKSSNTFVIYSFFFSRQVRQTENNPTTLEEISHVYIVLLLTRASSTTAQLLWMNASMTRRDPDWRNCTFIQILFIYLKKESQYFEYLLLLLNNPWSYIFIKV